MKIKLKLRWNGQFYGYYIFLHQNSIRGGRNLAGWQLSNSLRKLPRNCHGFLFPWGEKTSHWRRMSTFPILNYVQCSLNYFRAGREKLAPRFISEVERTLIPQLDSDNKLKTKKHPKHQPNLWIPKYYCS